MKYERIYLFEHGSLPALRESLEEWFDRYNNWRPHENPGRFEAEVQSMKDANPPRPRFWKLYGFRGRHHQKRMQEFQSLSERYE